MTDLHRHLSWESGGAYDCRCRRAAQRRVIREELSAGAFEATACSVDIGYQAHTAGDLGPITRTGLGVESFIHSGTVCGY